MRLRRRRQIAGNIQRILKLEGDERQVFQKAVLDGD